MAGYGWQMTDVKMAQHYASVGVDELVRRISNTVAMMAVDAYEQVAWFGSAIDARRNAFTNLPYDIMRGETVLADQDSLEDIDPRLDISYVLDDMFTDLDLHGAAYAYLETNVYGMNAKWRRWLPKSMTPRHNVITGELMHFERRFKGQAKKIELDDPNFIWLWMPSYRWENLPGVGVGNRGLLAASNIVSKDKFQNAFFENGALSPTLVRIKGFGLLDQDEKERTKNIFQRMLGGLMNAARIHPIDGDEVDVVTLMQNLKEMAMEELTKSQREEIAAGLGVPQNILLGNAANFATARQDDFNLYDKWVLPQAKNVIATQLNEKHYKRHGVKLIYRKERLDVYQDAMLDKSQALIPWRNAGTIDDNEVRPMLGFAERDIDENIEEDQDVPQRLLNPADNDVAGSDGSQIGQIDGLEGKAHFVGKEAYVSIDLANHPQLREIQERLQLAMVENGETLIGNWQDQDTFHITLVYCYDIDNEALDKATMTLHYDPLEAFPIYVTGVSVFNNPEGQALHLTVSHSPKLDYLQKRIWVEFSGHNTSEYSTPAQWQPHITMGYLPSGVPIPQIDFVPFELTVKRVQYMRDGYAVFEDFEAVESLDDLLPVASSEEVKQALADLNKWERLALKRHKEGTPEKASEFSSDHIAPVQRGSLAGMLSTATDVEQVKAIFAEAKQTSGEWLNYG